MRLLLSIAWLLDGYACLAYAFQGQQRLTSVPQVSIDNGISAAQRGVALCPQPLWITSVDNSQHHPGYAFISYLAVISAYLAAYVMPFIEYCHFGCSATTHKWIVN